jgi:hypothetical protein
LDSRKIQENFQLILSRVVQVSTAGQKKKERKKERKKRKKRKKSIRIIEINQSGTQTFIL